MSHQQFCFCVVSGPVIVLAAYRLPALPSELAKKGAALVQGLTTTVLQPSMSCRAVVIGTHQAPGCGKSYRNALIYWQLMCLGGETSCRNFSLDALLLVYKLTAGMLLRVTLVLLDFRKFSYMSPHLSKGWVTPVGVSHFSTCYR